MSNKRIRTINRTLHIVAGSMISAFIYSSSLRASDTYTAIMQFVVIPALIISGMFLWQQARVMKWFRRSNKGG